MTITKSKKTQIKYAAWIPDLQKHANVVLFTLHTKELNNANKEIERLEEELLETQRKLNSETLLRQYYEEQEAGEST